MRDEVCACLVAMTHGLHTFPLARHWFSNFSFFQFIIGYIYHGNIRDVEDSMCNRIRERRTASWEPRGSTKDKVADMQGRKVSETDLSK